MLEEVRGVTSESKTSCRISLMPLFPCEVNVLPEATLGAFLDANKVAVGGSANSPSGVGLIFTTFEGITPKRARLRNIPKDAKIPAGRTSRGFRPLD